ncbi:hypothetical protein HK405_005068 [Cladochytrium tenue]|nr:hypothetical protein HK405_005068 [Cladochytrium tenue]
MEAVLRLFGLASNDAGAAVDEPRRRRRRPPTIAPINALDASTGTAGGNGGVTAGDHHDGAGAGSGDDLDGANNSEDEEVRVSTPDEEDHISIFFGPRAGMASFRRARTRTRHARAPSLGTMRTYSSSLSWLSESFVWPPPSQPVQAGGGGGVEPAHPGAVLQQARLSTSTSSSVSPLSSSLADGNFFSPLLPGSQLAEDLQYRPDRQQQSASDGLAIIFEDHPAASTLRKSLAHSAAAASSSQTASGLAGTSSSACAGPADLPISEPTGYGTLTVFQATACAANAMLGTGILALPCALSVSGWAGGLILLGGLAVVTSRTARIVGEACQAADRDRLALPGEETPLISGSGRPPATTSYSDLVARSLGPGAGRAAGGLFLAQLLAAGAGCIVVAADSVVGLISTPDPVASTESGPAEALRTRVAWTAVAALLAATTFMDGQRFLASAGAVGVLSVFCVLGVLLYDGLITPSGPGSLWDPADTRSTPVSLLALALSSGVFLCGFDAHAIFPSIYHDLRDQRDFPKVIRNTYIIVFLFYVAFASVGYVMFGAATLPEITQNLGQIASLPRGPTILALGLTALGPWTRFSLLMRPVGRQLDRALLPAWWPDWLRAALSRASAAGLALGLAVAIPRLDALAALAGSMLSSVAAVVLPCIILLVSATIVVPATTFVPANEPSPPLSSTPTRRAVARVVVLVGLTLGVAGTTAAIITAAGSAG